MSLYSSFRLLLSLPSAFSKVLHKLTFKGSTYITKIAWYWWEIFFVTLAKWLKKFFADILYCTISLVILFLCDIKEIAVVGHVSVACFTWLDSVKVIETSVASGSNCQVWCCLYLPSFSEAVWTCHLTILSCLWGLVLLLTIWCHKFVLSVLYPVSLFISYITRMLFYLLPSISCTIRNYFNWIFLQPFWRVASNSYGKGRGVVGKKNSTTGILWQFCE